MMMRRFVAAALALVVMGTFCPRAALGADPAVPEAWKSLDPDGLRTLAVELYRKGEAGQAERQLLVGYLAGKYFGSAEQTRQPGTGNWREYVRHLRAEMSDATKAAWATKLRAAFTTVDLTVGEISVLSTTLADLGDAQPASVAAIQVTQRTGWKSWKPTEQLTLLGALSSLKEAGATARKLLAEQLTAQCLSDAAATQSVPLTSWRNATKALKDDLSAEQRQVWIAKLRGGFAESELDSNQFGCLVLACRYLGDAEADALAAVRVTETTGWKSWKASELLGLADRLSKLGEAGTTARAALAAHVQGTYLTSAEAARSLALNDWNRFVRALKADLSAQQRESWASALQAAFLGDELNSHGFRALSGTVRQLDEAKAAALPQALLTQTAGWKAWAPQETVRVLRHLIQGKADTAKAARAALVSHFTNTYLSSTQATCSIDCGTWSMVAGLLSRDLTAEQRVQWIGKLREAFLASPEAMLTLEEQDIQSIATALKYLGDQNTAELAAAMAKRGEEWKTWPPEALASLARELSKSATGREARIRLAEHLMAKYLPSRETARLVSCQQWSIFAGCLGKDITAEQRGQWAGKLKAAYAASAEDLKALKFAQLKSLGAALGHLDRRTAAEVVLGWFGGVDEAVLEEISARDLASVGPLLSGATDAEKAELAGTFNTRWEAAHQAKPLSWGHSSLISYACLQLGDMAKARTWAMRSYSSALGTEEARNLATPAVLDSVAQMLEGVGLTGKGKGYPAFATAAARLAKQGRLEDQGLWFYDSCALPLGTAETRQTLQAELTDAEGQVRLGVAQVLTWAYRQAGELKTWLGVLDGKVAASSGGDEKALWLLARGNAEMIVPPEPSPLRGRKWYDQALAAAASASCKFRVVETLVGGHAAIGRHDVGLSLLDSVAGQFAGTELAAKVEALRKETQDAKARYLAQQARYKAEHARRVKEAWRNELWRRLEAARSKGDQETVRQLERMLNE